MLPGLHVCCRHLKHRFQPILNSSPDPKKLPPDGASYSASAVFPRVCSMCTVSFGDCSEGSGWTRPHGAPDRVDTVAYPEAWQQPLKRGATEMDWAPGTDLLPCSPPPRLKRSRPSQLSSESSPSPAGYILLACILQLDVDYLPAARAPVWSGVAPERRPGTDQKSDHLRSEDISHCSCWAHFISQKVCWSRNKSNDIWADAVEPSHQSNTTHKTTLLHRKYCRSLTREGKSESLLTSNKSV